MPKTVILGYFGLSGSHDYPHILHKNLKITPKNIFEYSQMPLLTFYDDRIILQTVLNTEGQHANVTNVLRFSCYSCLDLYNTN